MITSIRISALATAFATLLGLFGGCGSSPKVVSSHDDARKTALDNVTTGRFEGGHLYTLDYPPVDYFEPTFGFRPDQLWLDDVHMAALWLGGGCTASFVSADGLVMTNKYCALGGFVQAQKSGQKLLEPGFYATSLNDERRVPNLAVEQVVEIRDVTERVRSAMRDFASEQEKTDAQGKAIASIQKQAQTETKLRAQVVALDNGAKYAMYLYKWYSDIRLVAAPELYSAHGGEFDNFTYPRTFELDFAFVRVYDDNGKPLKTDHYFKWLTEETKLDEPVVVVVGDPGRTSRLNTVAQLEYNRDVAYPFTARNLDDRYDVLTRYAQLHPEKKDEMLTMSLGIENGRKAYAARLSGLRDDRIMQRRKDFERQFHQKLEAVPVLKAKYGHVWDEIAAARNHMRRIVPEMQGLRINGLGICAYFTRAAALAKYASEMSKPAEARDKYFQGEALENAERALARFVKLDAEMEKMTLVKQLQQMKLQLGEGDELVRFLLQGQDNELAAQRLITISQLNDSIRYLAYTRDAASITASTDPFILAARMALPRLERIDKTVREINAKDQMNEALLGRALFDIYGTSVPPDATFTLRHAHGVVKGYEYNGTLAPPITTFYGLFDRNAAFIGKPSLESPEVRERMLSESGTSVPFVSGSDDKIIGGNSGSPMINKNKQVIGLVFDGNIESLPGDFIFAEDAGNRTVSVHAVGIFVALNNLSKADRLVRELRDGKLTAEQR